MKHVVGILVMLMVAAAVHAVDPPKEKTTLKGHKELVFSVAFSSDGKLLASSSADSSVKIWDVPAGKEQTTLNGHLGAVFSVAFAPDDKSVASAGEDMLIRLWDVAGAKEKFALKGHTSGVMAVAFSPSGKSVASAGLDNQARLWDLASHNTVSIPGAHRPPFLPCLQRRCQVACHRQ
jgi:WD40 repeat protein